MTMKLKLAGDLTLPLDTVTQTMAIVAKRRAGKSYTMRRLVEQLFRAGQQIVIVDPKGDQWGIRSSADGKGPGLPVVILGGERGDVPLEAGSGEIVAKLVVEERVSVLLDLSLFRKHEVATFMTAFLENLYRLKAREIYRTPVMLVIDEADAIAPQKPQRGEERMLGAAEDIVRRGGQRGIGCVVVTQRSAVLNKNVLTQAQILVALRTIAPQDLKAMDAWIQVHGEPAQRKTLMESLPALPTGDAWFWSPGWPTVDGIFKRVHVLPIETFDSGATPKPGEKRAEPKTAADVDLDALKRQMAATIEKAKAENPKELRKQLAEKDKRIRELEQARTSPASVKEIPPSRVETKMVKVQVLTDRQVGKFAAAVNRAAFVAEHAEELTAHARKLGQEIQTLVDAAQRLNTPPRSASPMPVKHQVIGASVPARRTAAPVRVPAHQSDGDTSDLKAGAREILATAGRYAMLRLTRTQLLTLAGGRSRKSSTSDAYLAELKRRGFLAVNGDDAHVITDEGFAYLGMERPEVPDDPQELLRAWFGVLKQGERTMLQLLVEAGPVGLTPEELAAESKYSQTSSTFDAYVANLRRNALVISQNGRLVAAEVLRG